MADQLREHGRVSRGWLGVVIQEVTRDLAEGFGLDRPHGALIAEILDGSPAELGGLREGDVIVRFNGKRIERSSELPHFVGRAPVGEESKLEIMRDGALVELELVIGELADIDGRVARRASGRGDAVGLSLQDLNAEQLARLDVEAGVLVTAVSGAGAQAGIQPGDVITRFNHKRVSSVDEVIEIAGELASGDTIPVLVLRESRSVFLPLKVP